jgi:hypothetical protein
MVDSRERFLQQIFDFLNSFMKAHGKVTEVEELSCTTKVVSKLDLGEFTFGWQRGHRYSMVEIFMGSQSYRKKIFSMIYWHGVSDCEVSTFSHDDWQQPLLETMSHAEELIETQASAKSRREMAAAEAQCAEEDLIRLRERAAKLKLL